MKPNLPFSQMFSTLALNALANLNYRTQALRQRSELRAYSKLCPSARGLIFAPLQRSISVLCQKYQRSSASGHFYVFYVFNVLFSSRFKSTLKRSRHPLHLSALRSEHILNSTSALQACFVLRFSALDSPGHPSAYINLLDILKYLEKLEEDGYI